MNTHKWTFEIITDQQAFAILHLEFMLRSRQNELLQNNNFLYHLTSANNSDMTNNVTTTDDYISVFEEGISFSRGMTKEMFGISLASAVASLSILVSLIRFWHPLMKKPAFQILFFIFLSNFLSSLGSMVGQPYSGSAACWFEGIITNIFTLSSILWTAVVVLLLYSTIAFRHPIAINIYFHLFCWGFPILATFLPLINSSYGATDRLEWCFVVSLPETQYWAPELWYWLSFYIWVWIAFFAIFILVVMILFKLKSIKNETRKRFETFLIQLVGYPIIILICWLPSSISDLQQYTNHDLVVNESLDHSTTVLSCLMGLLSTIYFWIVEKNVRVLWSQKGFSSFSSSFLSSFLSSSRKSSSAPMSAHIGTLLMTGNAPTLVQTIINTNANNTTNIVELFGGITPVEDPPTHIKPIPAVVSNNSKQSLVVPFDL